MSKFGLEGLTQVWAEELRAGGIRFYTLNPMATRTAMRAQAYPQGGSGHHKARFGRQRGVRRPGRRRLPGADGGVVDIERATGA